MAKIVPFPEAVSDDERPTLELSGPVLSLALEKLVAASEAFGGIENFANAVKLKAALFQDLLGEEKARDLQQDDFVQLCAFMATCRRRVAQPLKDLKFKHFRDAISTLLDGADDTTSADARVAAFAKQFPEDRSHRWVRDLAAEILHYTLPEKYPLMTRWVWDTKANTGVIREIWHGDNVDHMVIDVPDTYQTFLVLREELSQFLSDNGVFSDMLFYVDLLEAQVYGDYINAQGGSYLRTDFTSEGDPLEHTKRILGLDGVDSRTGRTRYKAIDGSPIVIDEQKWLS